MKQKRESIKLDKPFEKPKIARVIQLTGIRKTVAERLSYSHRTIPSATLLLDANVEKLSEFREDFEKKIGQKISFTAFIAKAVALALKNHSMLNSSIENDQVNIYEDINISIAIDTPDGLVAPAVFNVDRKNVPEISNEIKRLTENAKAGNLKLTELVGGTFTITNLGAFGVEAFIPLVNPSQTAILGLGTTSVKPIVTDNKVTVASMVTLSLVFDHRVVDGVPASLFLKEVKNLLENPYMLE
jgi:pyruvate dehydrogenase E2 component (dihydrolipoamide acetyltransferase)